MAIQRARDEADIRRRLDTLVNAIRAMGLEGLKSVPVDFESGRALLDLET